MISYKPLWHTLVNKNMGKIEMMEKAGISRGTLAKMSKDEYVALTVIEKICLALDCRVEEVVEIKRG